MVNLPRYKYPKILLINVPDYNDKRRDEPLGLEYLAAYLRKHGFSCDLLDANTAGWGQSPFLKIARLIAPKRYDLIGLTVFTHIFYDTIELIRAIKRYSPGAKIVLGGHHVTFTHKDVLLKYPLIDFVVRGEGELTLLDLARHMREANSFESVAGLTYRSKNNIKVNPPRVLIKNIDTLPFPARDRHRYEEQAEQQRFASVVSSRGCPCRCSFCSISAFYKSQPGVAYRLRSPADIAEEIEILVKDFGIKMVAFKDDNMFVNAKRLIKVTDILLAKGISLKYNLVARADDIVRNAIFLPLLKKRGLLHVEVGIESGAKNSLKRFSKDVTVATNKEAIYILHKNNIYMTLDYIMFEPDMTPSDLRQNVSFIKDLDMIPFVSRDFIPGELFHKLVLHPGTAYYEKMIKGKRFKGSIFRPQWDFRDEYMRKIYKFLRLYAEVLRRRHVDIKKLCAAKLAELNSSRDDAGSPCGRLKRSTLVYITYELDKVYLEFLDCTLTLGKKYNFSRRGFLEVKRRMVNRLNALKEKISAVKID